MQSVPIVYGMTVGEYALMLAGENWLSPAANKINAYNITTKPGVDTPFHVTVIKCKNYDHKTKYTLPVKITIRKAPMVAVLRFSNSSPITISNAPKNAWYEGTIPRLRENNFQRLKSPYAVFRLLIDGYGACTGKSFIMP